MKRAGILFFLMIFAAGIFSAAANNVVEYKNDLNIAFDVLKTHCKFQRPDYDPTKSQVVESQEMNTPTPVEEEKAREICVFPNPCIYSMKVSGVSAGDELMIYNNAGQLVLTQIAESDEETVDVSRLPEGIYHLAIVNSKLIEKIDFMK